MIVLPGGIGLVYRRSLVVGERLYWLLGVLDPICQVEASLFVSEFVLIVGVVRLKVGHDEGGFQIHGMDHHRVAHRHCHHHPPLGGH